MESRLIIGIWIYIFTSQLIKPSAIFGKNFILYVWQGSQYASSYHTI